MATQILSPIGRVPRKCQGFYIQLVWTSATDTDIKTLYSRNVVHDPAFGKRSWGLTWNYSTALEISLGHTHLMNPDAKLSPQTGRLNSSLPSKSYQYPFATAPDIIRSHQKDAYFQGTVQESLFTVLRKFYGAHYAHRHAADTRTVSELLYLACTTLLGNRTLGEEYCDLIQVEGNTLKLPDILRRSGYIFSAVLLPHMLSKILPGLQRRIRRLLEFDISLEQDKLPSHTRWTRIRCYLLDYLGTITSPSLLYASSLAVFYFTGAYYHISKRLFELRYVFTKRMEESNQRIGYEVLGVLLVMQMTVQSWLHFQRLILDNPEEQASSGWPAQDSVDREGSGGENVQGGSVESQIKGATSLERNTHTLAPDASRYSLAGPGILAWIPSGQQRKCTLCLEELKDPSATTCGHVFCWACIADWIREKPECPLCRQAVMAQHILPLRGSYTS